MRAIIELQSIKHGTRDDVSLGIRVPIGQHLEARLRTVDVRCDTETTQLFGFCHYVRQRGRSVTSRTPGRPTRLIRANILITPSARSGAK